ncbi:transcriptional regulator MalT [Hahella sp. CCB-MM4]|uniref:HTH-type transcriptional regulator MalT n=1 Tax=Hahella sp. (strain CCB-MM4) TaxID=1926491 RepID=UPI000B9BAD91|nr:HTH-type transcriptional regulator MalT [Hahella sp. CCB-MM4]OZG70988.1 transcriptional regulator MalT [Hahella sp. CCB-MM4]
MNTDELPDARPLIPSKIILPHVDSTTMNRPRLDALLNEATNKPLCIIRAPAGFGKTTLVAHWSSHQPGRTAWFQIDDLDNDAACFGRYLLVSLQQQLPELEQALERMHEVFHLYDLIWLVGKLCNELSTLDQRIILVLDDYHNIRNERIHEALRFFIQHQPTQLHLYILTRGEPPLGLANWRVRGVLQEIGADDLGFTLEEAQQFLQESSARPVSEGTPIKPLNPSQAQIIDRQSLEQVLERLNGWAAGLQIIALSAPTQDSINHFLRHFNGTHAHVLDFLAEEILFKQPKLQQEFLLKTGILDKFNPELATAVTGVTDSFYQIQELEKRGLFLVPLDEYRRWYRYHPFFAEFLRHQLELSYPADQIMALHQKAHDWWRDQHQVAEALGHALAIANTELIRETLTQQGWSLFEQGHITLIERCLQALPPMDISHNHQLTLLRAWVCLTQADAKSLQNVLSQAEQQLPEQVENLHWRKVSAEIHALKAQLCAIVEDTASAECHARQALKTAPESAHNVQAAALAVMGEVNVCNGNLDLALAHFSRAESEAREVQSIQSLLWTLGQQADILFHQGALPDAYQKQAETFQVARSHHLAQIPVMEFVHRRRAELLLEWLQFHEAKQHCDTGLRIIEHLDDHCQVPINALQAQIALHQEDLETAASLVARNSDLMSQHPCHSDWKALATSTQIRFWTMTGNHHAVRNWLSQQSPVTEAPNHFRQAQVRNSANAMLACSYFEAAINLLVPLIKQSQDHGLKLSEMRNQLLLAWGYEAIGQNQNASMAVLRALELAEPMRAIAGFLQMPDLVIDLYHQVQGQLNAQQNRHLQRILELSRRRQRPLHKLDKIPEQAKALALTPKEWEVLRLIGEGRSNENIAENMFVAPSTVRSHIKHIYQKLGIANRQEARRVSRDLSRGKLPGLLP